MSTSPHLDVRDALFDPIFTPEKRQKGKGSPVMV